MNLAALYTELVVYLVILMAPVTVVVSLFLWRLHAQDRAADVRIPKSRLRLSLMLAIEGTITAIGSAYLAAASVLRNFFHTALPAELAPVTVTVILAIELVPVISAVYLRWLRRKQS